MKQWWWRSCMGMAGSSMAGMSAFAAEVPQESAPYIETRYRYSNLHADGKPKRGHANTARLQLGYQWAIGHGWSAYAEGIRTWSLFGKQYDDGSARITPYPTEADPASTGITNAWVGYTQGDIALRAGRQYVSIDNGRFFSNNPWRQNLQSFDGAHVTWEAGQGTELSYYWLGRVNRTLGADFHDRDQRRWKLNAHLLHADQALPVGKLTVYGYFVRNDTAAVNSVKTVGLRYTGTERFGQGGPTLTWATEVARQYDYANNPADFSLGYHLLDATFGYKSLSARVGEEKLDGNGRNAVNVAYGAARAFNGWVVAFRIPNTGLRERYVGLLGSVDVGRPANWQVTYRHFRPVQGRAMLGDEVDVRLLVDLGRGFSVDLQYGDYRARRHGVDERKFWLIGEYRYGKPVK
ncbi:MAG TPA: alginate export family protein [Luteibacter sp.]|uniref:alginate export family protein n=1 Tax=Luteibacter sp. TaxID=1886636 RepID=UPI002F426C81